MTNQIAPVQSTDILLSYLLLGINGIVYLVLLYSAGKRNVKVYRPAVLVNIALFIISLGLAIATAALNTRPDFNQISPGVLTLAIFITLVWFGYWTWVLYKYASVMAAEVDVQQRKTGLSV